MGVIEAPRVQLTNGLFRTIEKPTSLPTAATEYPSRRSAQSFNQGGRPKDGAELTRNKRLYLWFHLSFPFAFRARVPPLSRSDAGSLRSRAWRFERRAA